MIIERPSTRPGQRGFTLVELLIALVIVGILTSVALPLYTRYQQRGYRAQALSDLGDCAQALERYYTVNFTYAIPAAAGGLGSVCAVQSPPTGTALYTITTPTATNTTFTLRATPVANTAVATAGRLEIDASGGRRWDKNNDGDTDDAGEDNWSE